MIMTKRRAFLAVLAAANLALAAPLQAADAAGYTRYGVRGPIAAKVSFNGAINYDKAGGPTGAMMYPAAGLAGFIAALATHAVMASAMQDAEKEKLRAVADKVLLPYLPALEGYTHEELLQGSLLAMRSVGEKRVVVGAKAKAESGEALIDSLPMFFMTQDQRALILEHAVVIKRPGKEKPYENMIRIVTKTETAPIHPETLRESSIRMYAQSLDLAIDDFKAVGPASDAGFRTVRYQEGGTERMERAQVVSEQCDQMVLRTLRGAVLVVPRKLDGASCNPVDVIQANAQ